MYDMNILNYTNNGFCNKFTQKQFNNSDQLQLHTQRLEREKYVSKELLSVIQMSTNGDHTDVNDTISPDNIENHICKKM